MIEAPELVDDPRFATAEPACKHREEMTEELEKRLATQDRAYWQTAVPRGRRAGRPDPRHASRRSRTSRSQTLPAWRPAKSAKLGELKLTGHGVNLERTPPSIRSAAPERGEHTDEILQGAGVHARPRSPPSTSKGAVGVVGEQAVRT